MFTMLSAKQGLIQITVDVDNYPLAMELDTESFSIISETMYKNLPSATILEPTSAQLMTYTGKSIKVLGSILINVCHNGQEKSLPLLVVSGDGPSLLGRNWLHQLKLDWTSVFCLQSETELEKVLTDHKDVFNDKLGTSHGTTVKLHNDPKSVSNFARPGQFHSHSRRK